MTLLSLNNISKFKKKTKYFYQDEHLYSTNVDARLRNKVKFTKNYIQYGGILTESKLLRNFAVKTDTMEISYKEL